MPVTGNCFSTGMITFERMKKWFFLLAIIISNVIAAQVKFSISTDVSLLRNFSPQQKFSAIGQTVQTTFHFTQKENLYAWINYYTEGKFKNNFTASAKSVFTTPQQLNYTATGRLTYRQISIGWKHYFKGSYNADNDVNIYGLAGFGFLFAKISNSHSTTIDSRLYNVPTSEGAGSFKRLSFDIGLGAELPLGGNFYAYADGRTWLPASSNASPYLHNQRNVPLPFMLCAGLRLLFDFSTY